MSQLEMTEIVVPDDVRRRILCVKHEMVVHTDMLAHKAKIRCKHCGKFMGEGDLHPNHRFLS